ncbi:hypothetical protein VNI00_012835 [Paramarasmius palmivorus]|uniref:Uncharacterized protein n=1 Tax=Paramarasmius palmivorus TaxID=297713 RepID=A0AAW0C526_9AGAR
MSGPHILVHRPTQYYRRYTEKIDCAHSSLNHVLFSKLIYPQSNLGISDLQCDHIVELQFVAARITPDMCGHFEKSPQDLSSFFAVLNGKKNLVDLPARVNGAKGVLFGGKSFDIGTTRKDAAGVASFFGLITTDAEASAIKINEEMEKIMGKGKGFTNFVKEYMNKVKVDFPTKIQKSLPQLSPASIPPAPGSNDLPVINETDAVIERCKAGKRSFQVWPMVRNLARQVSGKKISPEDCKQTCVVTTPKTSTNKSTAKASTKEAAKPPTSDRNAKPPQAKPATKPPPRSPVKPAAKAPVKKLAPKARRGSITSLD